ALPDDVQSLATAVLSHRLLPTAQAQLNRRTAEQVVLEIIQRTPVPTDPGAVRGGPLPPVQGAQEPGRPLYGQQQPGPRRL
ncbi:ATPase, partial [Streptomyces sp. SID8455]|nr:ATPase [Streptomyces sp. SID8455]